VVNRLGVALLGAVVALAAIAVLASTRDGIGEGHDTSHFLSAAANLRDGNGLSVAFSSGFDPLPTEDALAQYGKVPLTHYPPGYPMVLAVADVVLPGGLDAAARAVGVLAIGVVALAGYVLARAFGVAPPGAALVAAAAAFTPPALRLSMWAMSDALATGLLLLAAGVAVRSTQVRERHRVRLEWVAGVIAAVAAITRYNGIAGAVGAAVVVVLASQTWRERAIRAARVGAPAVVALVSALVIAALRHGDSPRPIAWHPPGRYDITALVDVTGMFAVGNQEAAVRRVAAVGVVVVCAALAGIALTHARRARAATVVLGAVAGAQLAVLLVTSTWLDTDVTADRRLMLPVELAVVVFAVSALCLLPPRWATWPVVAGIVAVRAVLPVGIWPEGVDVPHMGDPRPQLYDAVANLPESTIIVTNAPEAIWRDDRRASIVAPARMEKLAAEEIPDLPGRLAEMGRLVGELGGVLVLEDPRVFGIPVDNPRVLNPLEVTEHLPCAQILVETFEGFIYDLTPCATG
jgi:hypothetical protein